MRPRFVSAFAACLALAACSHRDRDDHANGDVKLSFDSAAAAASVNEPLGPGDVRVKSTDGAVILALVGDSVRFQLSDSLRNTVKQSIDAKADSAGGIGAMIAKSVSGVVTSAMGFVVRIPVSEIENIRYEDGRIEFDTRGEHSKFSMSGKGNRSDGNAKFTPEDGEKFVAAVKARQAELKR